MRSLKRITTRIIAGVFCLTSIFASGVTAFADSKGETAGYKHFYEEKHKKWSETENKEIIVKYKDEEKGEYIKSSIQKKLSISSFKLKNRLRKHQIEVLEIGKDDNIDEVIEEFKNNSGVEYVQPNYKLQLFSIPNDPEFRGQWGLFNLARIYNEYGMDINVLPAWDLTMGSSDVIVGVIDTGIDINHPDLSANIYRNIRETANNGIDDDGNGYIDDIAGWDFYSNDNTVFDSAVWDAHGTHVAGIISAASNGQGVVGVAPNVKILPLKIGDENEGLDTDKAIAAIDYAESLGVKIINCSWGSYHNNPALYDRMRRSDIIFVCAVGNDTCDINYTRAYPAGFDLPNVISVAAVDSRGSLAEFSNYGSDVDVAAPGVDILSTLPDNSYGYMDGTSMSAPFVAGVCALLKSYYSQASNTQILNRLKENVVEVKSLKDKVKGLLDAGAAFDNTNKRIAVMSGYIPSGLDTSVTDNSITLSWDSIEGVNSYEVEIDREVTKTVTEATYYIHEELTPGSIHMFRVRSKIEGPQPTWSEAVIGSTLEPGMGTGLLGEYYDNMNFSGYYGAWIDETVNFDWNAGAPGEYMENDTFSVRWTGYVEPKYTEEYTFYANAGDGIRLWIDGQLIIDDWRDKGITESAGTISLNANHKYNIRMEYYESLGVSKAQLWWSSQTQQKEIVPKEHLYPSKEGGRWSSKTNMPTTRFGMGVTELNGEIYVAGGMLSSGSIINTVEKYNPVSDIWSASPGLSTQSAGGSLASLNGKLYAVGGFGPDIYDNLIYKPEIYEYHPGSQSWNHLSTLSSGRASMATAVLNDRIYVIGGENEYDYLNNLDVFDPVTRSCIPKASMPTSRSCLTAAVVNGKIYAIGGLRFDNTGGYILNTVEEYDPVRDVWTQKSSMMIPRMAPSAAVVNGKIYVMGGVNPVLGSLGIVEEYDPLTDTWSLVESMPTASSFSGAAAVGNKIYSIGGMSLEEDTCFNTVEEFIPPVPAPEDTTAPVIELYQTNCTVSEAVYSVSGRVSEASIVKINGIMAALSDELIFNANIPLMEASNNLLVEATDLSGNTATSYMNVNYDMSNDKAAPVITLDQAGGTVSQPSYTISGRVNEYSSIKIGSEAADLTSNLTFTKTITLSPGSNVIKVEAVDPAQNKSELSIQVNYQQPAPPPPPQSGGQDTTIIQIPPSPIPGVSFDNGVIEVNPKLENGGVAVVKLEASDLTKAFEKAEEDEYGNKTVTIKASYVKGATKYNCTLPNDVLTAGRQKLVEIRTPAGNVVLPGNMFGKNELADTDEVTISIGFADILVLSADMEQKIADRPAIELNVLVNGKIIEWNNPYAPAAVSVDYDAKAYELEDSEHIVVWSIDESGNIKTVPNGKYNKDTKKVTFTTTCSGKYTVSFVKRSFKDISKYSWASKQIEVLASKGIVNGTSESTFTPGSNITRADFMIMLVKALGLNAKIEANFNDVKKTDYYYEAVGIARQLGITSGVGNNNFLPKDPIKREDMMVFVEKALKIANKVESEGSLADLKRFDDTSDISSYALKSIAALVREGIVSGNGTKINPKSYTTRAEVAALIYKIYSK